MTVLLYNVQCYTLESCMTNVTQQHKTYNHMNHVTLDIAYAQCYNVHHTASVLLYWCNVTGTVTFDQSGISLLLTSSAKSAHHYVSYMRI